MSVYLERDEPWERLATGQPTYRYRAEAEAKSGLEEWDERWKKVSEVEIDGFGTGEGLRREGEEERLAGNTCA